MTTAQSAEILNRHAWSRKESVGGVAKQPSHVAIADHLTRVVDRVPKAVSAITDLQSAHIFCTLYWAIRDGEESLTINCSPTGHGALPLSPARHLAGIIDVVAKAGGSSGPAGNGARPEIH